MAGKAEATVTISNKKGLHARASAKFVKTASSFDANVIVTRLGEPPESLSEESVEWTVCGTSILGLMMLAAEPGVELLIEAEGAQAEEAVAAIQTLVQNKFDEDA
ncbi:MAG: HPr family phosphocarrier protein [Rickettsiales bacterium]|nr:HPr family phosphocarrier protein [Rickettsiales bacterium]